MSNGTQRSLPRPTIPPEQLGVHACECGSTIFDEIACVRFTYDRLAPTKLTGEQRNRFKCAKCGKDFVPPRPDGGTPT